MSKKLRKLTTGVYADQYSVRAIVNCAAGRQEKRFDHGTPLAEIKRWRNETKVKLETKHPQKRAGVIGRGTFSADVRRYLKDLTIASWKSRRSELKAWEKRFGTVKRRRVTVDHVKKTVKAWSDAEVPAKTILNRVRALTAMYHALDGESAWTPADGVALPKVRRRVPDYVPPETLIAVAERLKEHADPKWRGRFMVMAACGARPVHLKRALAEHVDIERATWNVIAAKDGAPIRMPLNADMVAAWKVFIEANAWGEFDAGQYARVVRSAGWPMNIDPYNAKHSFGQDLGKLGIGREVIADWYGHTDPSTTRTYVPNSSLAQASAAIDGRLGWGGTPKKRARAPVVDVEALDDAGLRGLLSDIHGLLKKRSKSA
jgi:integrase